MDFQGTMMIGGSYLYQLTLMHGFGVIGIMAWYDTFDIPCIKLIFLMYGLSHKSSKLLKVFFFFFFFFCSHYIWSNF